MSKLQQLIEQLQTLVEQDEKKEIELNKKQGNIKDRTNENANSISNEM